MGYEKHVPSANTLLKRNQGRWLRVVRKIQQWIYSWMKPGYVEDEDESHISKILLMQFVSSAPILIAAEGNLFLIIRIFKWLRGYVFIHQDLYLYNPQKKQLTFLTAHSSAHDVSISLF